MREPILHSGASCRSLTTSIRALLIAQLALRSAHRCVLQRQQAPCVALDRP